MSLPSQSWFSKGLNTLYDRLALFNTAGIGITPEVFLLNTDRFDQAIENTFNLLVSRSVKRYPKIGDGLVAMKRNQSNRALALLASFIMIGAAMAYLKNSEDSLPVSEAFRGIWVNGRGGMWVITEQGGTRYEYTRQTCIQTETFTNTYTTDMFANALISNDQMTITFRSDKPDDFDLLFPNRLTKLSDLPVVCQPDNLIVANTPNAIFEHLWHTFNDYYAFFDERGIDWSNLYSDISPTVSHDMSEDELLEVIDTLLTPLDDGHIELMTDDDRIDYSRSRSAEKYVTDTFPNQTEFDDIDEYAMNLRKRWKKIVSGYFASGKRGSAGGDSGKKVQWAVSVDNVGYLYIDSMGSLAGDKTSSGREDVEAINKIMKSVLADIINTDALIIDVRINDGGWDPVGLAIANHFTDQSIPAFSKYTHTFGGNKDYIKAMFRPATSSPYLKPIAVLASENTASAAEVFLIAMSALPHATIMGETSRGIMADSLYKSLPNNWKFTIPNAFFIDINGNKYEVTGVPPQISAPTDFSELFDQEKDSAIEAALTALGY